jgi:hypothetical protein
VGDQIDLVNCRSCRIPQPALGTQNSGFLCNQRLALALEKSIWASFHGQAPDSSWAGTLSGAQFLELIGQLIELLTSREAEFWPSASTPWDSRATILPMLSNQRSRWACSVGWNAKSLNLQLVAA